MLFTDMMYTFPDTGNDHLRTLYIKPGRKSPLSELHSILKQNKSIKFTKHTTKKLFRAESPKLFVCGFNPYTNRQDALCMHYQMSRPDILDCPFYRNEFVWFWKVFRVPVSPIWRQHQQVPSNPTQWLSHMHRLCCTIYTVYPDLNANRICQLPSLLSCLETLTEWLPLLLCNYE